jgi:hypothetical protein
VSEAIKVLRTHRAFVAAERLRYQRRKQKVESGSDEDRYLDQGIAILDNQHLELDQALERLGMPAHE